jgi:hypothetical protein
MQIFNRFYRIRYFGQKHCPFLFKNKVTAPRQPKPQLNPDPEIPIIPLEALTQEDFQNEVEAQYDLEKSLVEESASGAGSSEGTLKRLQYQLFRLPCFLSISGYLNSRSL